MTSKPKFRPISAGVSVMTSGHREYPKMFGLLATRLDGTEVYGLVSATGLGWGSVMEVRRDSGWKPKQIGWRFGGIFPYYANHNILQASSLVAWVRIAPGVDVASNLPLEMPKGPSFVSPIRALGDEAFRWDGHGSHPIGVVSAISAIIRVPAPRTRTLQFVGGLVEIRLSQSHPDDHVKFGDGSPLIYTDDGQLLGLVVASTADCLYACPIEELVNTHAFTLLTHETAESWNDAKPEQDVVLEVYHLCATTPSNWVAHINARRVRLDAQFKRLKEKRGEQALVLAQSDLASAILNCVTEERFAQGIDRLQRDEDANAGTLSDHWIVRALEHRLRLATMHSDSSSISFASNPSVKYKIGAPHRERRTEFVDHFNELTKAFQLGHRMRFTALVNTLNLQTNIGNETFIRFLKQILPKPKNTAKKRVGPNERARRYDRIAADLKSYMNEARDLERPISMIECVMKNGNRVEKEFGKLLLTAILDRFSAHMIVESWFDEENIFKRHGYTIRPGADDEITFSAVNIYIPDSEASSAWEKVWGERATTPDSHPHTQEFTWQGSVKLALALKGREAEDF